MPEGADARDEDTPAGQVDPEDSLRRAVASSRLSGLAASDRLDARTLIGAMGGVRGILEAILPGLLFLVVFTVTRGLLVSVLAAGAVGVVFTVIRLAQRQSFTQAVAGLVGFGLSAGLALLNDKPEDYYVVGFWTNGVYLVALLVSVAVRWPVVGVIVGLLLGEGTAWRTRKPLFRVYSSLTVMWACLFALRLVVQLPLYFSGNVELLGSLRLLMGVPLYAPLLIVTWLVVDALRKRHAGTAVDGPAEPS